jgi:hypothetical protein
MNPQAGYGEALLTQECYLYSTGKPSPHLAYARLYTAPTAFKDLLLVEIPIPKQAFHHMQAEVDMSQWGCRHAINTLRYGGALLILTGLCTFSKIRTYRYGLHICGATYALWHYLFYRAQARLTRLQTFPIHWFSQNTDAPLYYVTPFMAPTAKSHIDKPQNMFSITTTEYDGAIKHTHQPLSFLDLYTPLDCNYAPADNNTHSPDISPFRKYKRPDGKLRPFSWTQTFTFMLNDYSNHPYFRIFMEQITVYKIPAS